MGIKTPQKEFSAEGLKQELSQIKSGKGGSSGGTRLKEIAKAFAENKQWESAKEAFQYIQDENERNLLIGEIIEEFLLPAHEMDQAKQFAKFLTPLPEIQPLVFIRIALAENDTDQARKIAERLPSPLSRNFAFMQIAESYVDNNDKKKLNELTKLILENSKTVYDIKSRSYLLREVAIDLFLANNEKEMAKEIAMQIPDETMKSQTLRKIG